MRDLSLLEQKKLQWAKEKEELSKLNDFFAATSTTHQFERTSIRTYYSNVDISSSSNSSVKSSTMPRRANYYHEPYDIPHNFHKNNNDSRHNISRAYATDSFCDNDAYQTTNGNHDLNHSSNRAPLLPPIGRNARQKQMSTQTRQNGHFGHQNTDEETSGYLSDRMSPLMWANQMQQPAQSHRQPNLPKDYSNYIYPSSGDELAPELDAMKIEERRRIPKHKAPAHLIDDNGHETDFSIPKTPSSMCSENRDYSRLSSCPPCRKDKEERAKWGNRHNNFYDNVSKESSVKSDGPCWLERGFADSGDESVRSYSFIRGQNAPIDPNILAERTTKRIKALELQNAIKAQVEERERLRKIELEKAILEERRQEENLRQQMESNEQRFEEEQRKTREKLEREQRKEEIMRLAIEKARQEAEMERARKRRSTCNSAELDSRDENHEMHNETESIDMPASPPHPCPSDGQDDGEKILIGTPIRMRKKTLNKTYTVPLSAKKDASLQSEKEGAETNVDGIALVLQTLPPVMPLSSNDLINLNQNINNLNTSNIQLAVMLAHQMQQLNTIAHQQNPVGEISNRTTAQETNSVEEKPVSTSQNDAEPQSDVCKQCTTGFHRKDDPIREQEKTPSGDLAPTKDAATVTDDFDMTRDVTNESEANETRESRSSECLVVDAATQTDKKQEICFQCRYHQCHHHHVVVKDLSDGSEDVKMVTVNHANSKPKCSDKDCSSASTAARNICVEPAKMEDRPKWGVNRPLHQYIKASERDPFYLRNKRRKHQKQQFIEEQSTSCDLDCSKDDSTPERSTSPSPSIITNSTVTLSSPQLVNRKRSICTEILPIKTDMNGRVYLNFTGASLQVTEDEQKPTSKQRPHKTRIMNRSQTANGIRPATGEVLETS